MLNLQNELHLTALSQPLYLFIKETYGTGHRRVKVFGDIMQDIQLFAVYHGSNFYYTYEQHRKAPSARVKSVPFWRSSV